MALFENSEIFEKILVGFFKELVKNKDISKKLLDSKLIIRFNYSEPDLSITVDCSVGDEIEILVNDNTKKPEVEMWMKAEIAHKFWFGKVNLIAALTRKQMIAKGPIPKILKLLPAIKPAYSMYPKYLNENGFKEYNIYS